MPVAGGVVEYGSTNVWNVEPTCPIEPKAELKRAFTEFGAVYVIYWARQGGNYVSVADYTCPARLLAIKNQRGDDETYANSCKKNATRPREHNWQGCKQRF